MVSYASHSDDLSSLMEALEEGIGCVQPQRSFVLTRREAALCYE